MFLLCSQLAQHRREQKANNRMNRPPVKMVMSLQYWNEELDLLTTEIKARKAKVFTLNQNLDRKRLILREALADQQREAEEASVTRHDMQWKKEKSSVAIQKHIRGFLSRSTQPATKDEEEPSSPEPHQPVCRS